ncbi:SGNH/GDSL hydrolase family protein [Planococcus sp. ISL-110]|uniref:SGNH/GDSL hydrolase family protein n=1 Tax=Planococcus sp. ISL-110 TaxID=2819167 RepID=UPI001BE6135C|nr:SGNH/GDSL hydrolase family protein [Planococcus sp. ISL-110]MBT2572010.1 SGNH/GDSL hydrolase family protein [Planococcus sp. ISL-110]
MNLYKIGAAIAVIICVVVLVFSYLTWQDKLENVLDKPEEVAAQTGETKKEELQTKTSVNTVNVEELTLKMDIQVRELLLDRHSNDETLKMLITGSAALDSGAPGYAELLKDAVTKAYGDFVEMEVLSIEGTSQSLVNVDLSAGYDLVLLEPMTLMNNDRLAIEQEREHIKAFDAAMTAEVADAVLLLHPPQPIYGAGYYLAQVAALDEFAATNGYAYIDHWSAWPDTDDELLKDYLTDDGLPNDKGAETWAQELEAYFIAD